MTDRTDQLLDEGQSLLDHNRLDEAYDHYRRLCATAPENAEVWFKLGVVEQTRESKGKAIKYFAKAIAIDPEYAEAWIMLSNAQLAQADYLSAEQSIQRAIQLWPEYKEANFLLAAILESQGKTDAAIRQYREALKHQPHQIAGWRHLAQLEEKMGRWRETEISCRKALALNPSDSECRLMLARSLLLQMSAADALPEFERVLERQPENSVAWKGYAGTLEMLGELDRAGAALRKSLELNSTSANSWFLLAMIDFQTGDFVNALAHSTRSADLQPGYEPALVLKGDLLRIMGRLEESLTEYDMAINQPADHANLNAVAGKAMALNKLGKHDEAYEVLLPYLENGKINPKLVIAYAGLCIHHGDCKAAIKLLEKYISEPNTGKDSKQNALDSQEMHHYLGRLYDKTRNYSCAFGHFVKANKFKKQTSPFSSNMHLRLVDEIIGDYQQENLNAAPNSGCNSDRPIFILGMPRSGTTLVEQILCSHSSVFGGGEVQEFPRIAAALDKRPNSNLVRPPLIADLTETSLRTATDRYLNAIYSISGDAQHVTDKMPYNFFHLGLIQIMFPKCKVIHCIRDPLDTCLSIYFQNFSGYQGFASDLRDIGIYYIGYQRLMRHWQHTLDLPIHMICYETLVEDQEAETRKLLEFCELDWDKSCLDFYKNPRVALTASANQIRKPMYRTSIGRSKYYEKYLNDLNTLFANEGVLDAKGSNLSSSRR